MTLSYDEIMEKIYDLRSVFIMRYGLKPNTVYIGDYELHIIKRECSKVIVLSTDSELSLFDMRIRKSTDGHISVGLMIEDNDSQ